ncbi:uncharacterized protein BXZ73DRAFT_91336 [Epithele typhae]|uniref:uncharacterized protein n=1 Tax=Epithele typhae TaxID=378194 RepID=UPI002007B319|nr:uncharacterized protein BXZ73DRAFT_91336 [Epithele typhae]KAH9924355.1 hypothetical protein BXZ73DRAFT_91336 [Epithele typhae]
MATIADLPVELIEDIVLLLDPLDVSRFVQTCSAYHLLLYSNSGEHLWRELYLLQPFDDPRQCLTPLGRPLPRLDWKDLLQRVMRTRTILANVNLCKPEERTTVLQTLVDMVSNCVPSFIGEPSRNHAWVALMIPAHLLRPYPRDFAKEEITRSRAFVYAMRNYKYDNDFGPFRMDSTGRVDWVHIRALHHVISMHIVPSTEETSQAIFTVFPMSMPWTQSVIPDGLELLQQDDWAGVGGTWHCSFAFMDHQELLLYNASNAYDEMPLDTSIFDDPNFTEVYRTFPIEMRVLGTEIDPDHPGFPRIQFGGSVEGHSIMVGHVRLTPDNQIRWRFTSGEQGNAIWSSEGIQVGNVRSKFGILGAWTTVLHDSEDPVGPFWLWKD